MKKIKDSTEFKESLMQLVRNDYGFKLYNYNENGVRISFFHLNSYHNAFCSMQYQYDKEPFINWQQATPNKKIGNLVAKIVDYIARYYYLQHNYDFIVNEFKYFEKLSNTIYNAKYSIENNKHIYNF